MSADTQYVAHDTGIALVAALLAGLTRAAILTALLDGRPLAAGELARLAGVSAATASAHLARLLDGGLVNVTKTGQAPLLPAGGPGDRRGARRRSRTSARAHARAASANPAKPPHCKTARDEDRYRILSVT